MQNRYILLVSMLGGLFVAAFGLSVGLSLGAMAVVFVVETIFVFGCIIFGLRIFPELLSRHLERQLKRRSK